MLKKFYEMIKNLFFSNKNTAQYNESGVLAFLKQKTTQTMVTAITQGVKVSVRTEYQPDYSSPLQHHYVFMYEITIENHSEYTVQLLRRHWYINDAALPLKEVEGEGVVGQQPIIEPNDIHRYTSGCNLRSGMGKMRGIYLMQRLFDGKIFEVEIPEFALVVPFRLN